MENSRKVAREKRGYEESVEEEAIHPQSKKSTNVPALASVIVEALKVDGLQKFCSSLEPLFRKIVSEELECALTKLGHAKLAGRSSHQRIDGHEGRKLHLHFKSKLPPHLFTGGKVEGEQGAAIHVVLLDKNTGCIVQMGPESGAKLNVVVLEGDFNDEPDDDWTQEHFESYEVKERDGKRPLLNGETQVILKEGIGTLGDLIFTDNSSWIRSRKFRLGVKIASGFCDGIRVREAKTEAFAVKDHRGELYKKHYPPELHDEVWRLERIAKDGALHKKLITAKISTVEDFLRLLVRDPQSLRNVLGSGMSNRMWDSTVEHAKTCDLGGKLYVYYTDETRSIGAVFNHIYELRGLITDEHFLSMESLSHSQKVSVDSLVNQAYNNWNHVVEYDSKILLNSLNSRSKKGMEALSAARAVIKPTTDHYFLHPEEHTQLHVSYNCQPSAHQLIEFPFTILNPRDPPQAAFTSNVDNPSYHSGDWSRSRNEQGLGEIFSSEIRLRSSEMLENDDMQQLLKTFNTGVGVGIGAAFSHSDESCYGYNTRYERGRSSGKAVVSWLKLKAALRWGIFIRKRAAEKRAQLVELD